MTGSSPSPRKEPPCASSPPEAPSRLAEGEISELHVGLKGTMNALFLKDLAEKTRRGLRGRVEAGASGGGLTYGYDVVSSLERKGERRINEAEAAVVRRIFASYRDGQSPKRIALELNRDGVPGPRGGQWAATTVATRTVARGS